MQSSFFVLLMTGLLALSTVQYADCAAIIPEFTEASDRDTGFVPTTSSHLIAADSSNDSSDDGEFRMSSEAIEEKQDNISKKLESLDINFDSISEWIEDEIGDIDMSLRGAD